METDSRSPKDNNADARAAEARGALLGAVGAIEAARRRQRAEMQKIVAEAKERRRQASQTTPAQYPWQAAPDREAARIDIIKHVVDVMHHRIAAANALHALLLAVHRDRSGGGWAYIEGKHRREAVQRLIELGVCASREEADAEILLQTERVQGLPADELCAIEPEPQVQHSPADFERANNYWRGRYADMAQYTYENLPEDRRNGPAIEAVIDCADIDDAIDAAFYSIQDAADLRNGTLCDLVCAAMCHRVVDQNDEQATPASRQFAEAAEAFVDLAVAHAKVEADASPPARDVVTFVAAATGYERAEARLNEAYDQREELHRKREEILRRIEELCGPEYAATFRR